MSKTASEKKITFLGDISLNDKYNELYRNGEKPFEGVKDILFSSDFVVGNLECIAKIDKGENLLKKPRLKTNLETLNYLKDINLGLALLAHNHVYDNLEDGFLKTVKFLDDNDIAHIGAGLSPEQAEKPFIRTFNGIRICILNYVTQDTNPNLPKNATVYPNWFKETKVITDIKKYKKTCDKVILCLHWGGRCEGGRFPDWEQPFIARRLMDAGADLIVGGHSHTFQPFEEYHGKHIFYSLGNFCFSDIVSDGKFIEIDRKIRMKSAIIIYKPTSNECEVMAFDFKRYFLKFDKNGIKDILKRNEFFNILRKSKALWQMYFLKMKYIDPVIFYFYGNDHKFFTQLCKLNFGKIRRFLRI